VSEDGSDDSIFFNDILDAKYLRQLKSTLVNHDSKSAIALRGCLVRSVVATRDRKRVRYMLPKG